MNTSFIDCSLNRIVHSASFRSIISGGKKSFNTFLTSDLRLDVNVPQYPSVKLVSRGSFTNVPTQKRVRMGFLSLQMDFVNLPLNYSPMISTESMVLIPSQYDFISLMNGASNGVNCDSTLAFATLP